MYICTYVHAAALLVIGSFFLLSLNIAMESCRNTLENPPTTKLTVINKNESKSLKHRIIGCNHQMDYQ